MKISAILTLAASVTALLLVLLLLMMGNLGVIQTEEDEKVSYAIGIILFLLTLGFGLTAYILH